MDKKKALPTICRQCRKEIKTELIVCVPCDKSYHPSYNVINCIKYIMHLTNWFRVKEKLKYLL